MKKIWIVIGTFFGAGHLPIAPGTWASAAVALIAYFFSFAAAPFAIQAGIAAVVFLIGIPAASACERHFATKDPRPCVIDEVAGQLVALWLLPHEWGFYVASFFLFRIFDIIKPFPAQRSESLPRGLGIMADDVLVGGYAMALLVLVHRFIVN